MTAGREDIAEVHTFPELVRYLRDQLDWPISASDFEDLVFDYSADDLGIDPRNAAKIVEIKRLRPLSTRQPWGIFFVKFEPKRLPVVALRRILSGVALKKRASANSSDHVAWAVSDLLFISNYGEGDSRQISFAHFSQDPTAQSLPTLKVLGWDNLDTPLHLDAVAAKLTSSLVWPTDDTDLAAWRSTWESAFTLRHREVVTTSREMAIRLARLARAIRDRITTALTIETSSGPLTQLMGAVRASLVHDLDGDGFADVYAQTIAYGLLSARIADPEAVTAGDLAGHMRTNPLLRDLMQTFLRVGGNQRSIGGPGIDFDELGVAEVVDLLNKKNMEAVLRDFGDRNPEEDPVIHFYELFLKEYDERQRTQRGVFYTPRQVVSYIVRSIDSLLRTEFSLGDGLADISTWAEVSARNDGLLTPVGLDPELAFVQILDPATGTGTFLVEVIALIHRTMVDKWRKQGHSEGEIVDFWNEYVPLHLLPRLHGYELLMAPYAIAHLKVGLKLHETGYRFDSDQRARIYLTNSLEPAEDYSDRFDFAIPALAHEARAVNEVKRDGRFTVVVGNPPYAGVSSNMSEGAQRMVDAYRTVDGAALNERKLWLQDDYVKFIRKAQTIIDGSRVGIVGYITNHGYLDNPTFRGMRQSLMGTFHRLRLLDLHGNANKRERPPDGMVDKNVFDIRQGVAILLATRLGSNVEIKHADLWGSRESKYEWFEAHDVGNTSFAPITPGSPFYFFEPENGDHREEYEAGFKLTEAMPLFGLGFQTSRDHLVVAFNQRELEERIDRFLAPHLSDAEVRDEFFHGKVVADYAAGDTRQWSLSEARLSLREDQTWPKAIRFCLYRPFDRRVILYDKRMVDWPRPEVLGHLLEPNLCLIANRQSKEDFAVLCSIDIPERKIAAVYDASSTFPLYLYPDADTLELEEQRVPNLSPAFLRAIATSLGVQQGRPSGMPAGVTPEDILFYVYSVFHSPGYRNRYAEFVKVDFPRLPLPTSLAVLRDLADIGDDLVALHLMKSRVLDRPITTYEGPTNPEVGRFAWSSGTLWLDAAVTKQGELAQSGAFHGLPQDVWDFHIGGYRVCEKWLKDRKGRVLSKEDISHYQRIVVAIFETIRLMNEVDQAIDKHGGWPNAFVASYPPELAGSTST